MLDRRGAAGGDDPGHAALRGGERFDLFGLEGGPQAARIGEAGARQRLRVQRAVFGGEECALALRGGTRPALAHLVAVQPIAAESALPLPGHLLLEAVCRPRLASPRGGFPAPRTPRANRWVPPGGGAAGPVVSPAAA